MSHLLVKAVTLIVQTMRTSIFLGKFLIREGAFDGDCYRDPQLVKMQNMSAWGAQLQLIHLQCNSIPKAQRTSQMRGQKEWKGQGTQVPIQNSVF